MAIDENEFQAHVSKGFMDIIGALQTLQPVLDRHENAIKDITKALEGVRVYP